MTRAPLLLAFAIGGCSVFPDQLPAAPESDGGISAEASFTDGALSGCAGDACPKATRLVADANGHRALALAGPAIAWSSLEDGYSIYFCNDTPCTAKKHDVGPACGGSPAKSPVLTGFLAASGGRFYITNAWCAWLSKLDPVNPSQDNAYIGKAVSPIRIIADPSGAFVTSSDNALTPPERSITRVPTEALGGSNPETLPSTRSEAFAGETVVPWAISATKIAWFEITGTTFSIRGCGRDLAQCDTIVNAIEGVPRAISITDGALYFAYSTVSNATLASRTEWTRGAPNIIATAATVGALTVDTTYLYWTADHTIFRCSLSSQCAPTPIGTLASAASFAGVSPERNALILLATDGLYSLPLP